MTFSALVDDENMEGSEVFGFKTPKKSGQMAQKGKIGTFSF